VVTAVKPKQVGDNCKSNQQDATIRGVSQK